MSAWRESDLNSAGPDVTTSVLVSGIKVGNKNKLLRKSVGSALQEYLDNLDGVDPSNLYEMVITEIEKPLLETVMKHCENNQSKAASCLGINRGTLRKKLREYQIIE